MGRGAARPARLELGRDSDYEADRPAIIGALTAPGSKARNERWALDVAKFQSIGTLRRPALSPKAPILAGRRRARLPPSG